jgi:hypothetical protein
VAYRYGADQESFVAESDKLSIEHLPWFNKHSLYGSVLVAVSIAWVVLLFVTPSVLEHGDRFQVCFFIFIENNAHGLQTVYVQWWVLISTVIVFAWREATVIWSITPCDNVDYPPRVSSIYVVFSKLRCRLFWVLKERALCLHVWIVTLGAPARCLTKSTGVILATDLS